MLDVLRTAAAYFFDLGILVFFHELGHYLAARSQGVVVETFSIGFGPSLFSWRAKSGTVWRLAALPLGGYVKMQGWGEPAAETDAADAPGSFSSAKLSSKALIVAAGPFANFVLAFVLLAGLFAFHGRLQMPDAVVGKVVPGSAAAGAGLREGDRILAIDGHKMRNFEDLVREVVAHPDQTLRFKLTREGHMVTQPVTLGEKRVQGEAIGSLGVYAPPLKLQRLGPLAAVHDAAKESWQAIVATSVGIFNLIVHQQGVHQLRGMIGIAQITGKVAADGIASLVGLVAMISINLGLVNLIPIPILDGGHLLFYAIEAVTGRKLPERAREIGLRFGLAVIASLFFVTTLNDLARLGAVGWVSHLFG
ncbi:MAG: RIP metalloprotease RseP [Rhodospirillales bacterium 20-64-7]|nr:MAG: RIP metalloprotease RseP [Rhodospirillales bacterium 20-64-7]